jgi:hypothetical protein
MYAREIVRFDHNLGLWVERIQNVIDIEFCRRSPPDRFRFKLSLWLISKYEVYRLFEIPGVPRWGSKLRLESGFHNERHLSPLFTIRKSWVFLHFPAARSGPTSSSLRHSRRMIEELDRMIVNEESDDCEWFRKKLFDAISQDSRFSRREWRLNISEKSLFTEKVPRLERIFDLRRSCQRMSLECNKERSNK